MLNKYNIKYLWMDCVGWKYMKLFVYMYMKLVWMNSWRSILFYVGLIDPFFEECGADHFFFLSLWVWSIFLRGSDRSLFLEACGADRYHIFRDWGLIDLAIFLTYMSS